MKIIKKVIMILVIFLVASFAGIYFMPGEYRAVILYFTLGKWTSNIEDEKMLHENKFDRNLWREAGSEDYEISQEHRSNCTRGKMYYDLKDNYLKKGMSEEEVFSLLGKPTYGLKYPDNKNHNYCLKYKLGCCTKWISGGDKLLLVCLKNGKVIDMFKDSRNNNGETFKIEKNGE